MTPEKKLRGQMKGWSANMQTLFLYLFELPMSPELQMVARCDAYAEALRDIADAIERTYGSKAK